MKYQLIAPGRVPYGGRYELNLPEKGIVGFGTAFQMLESNVRKYRIANGIPTGLGFSEELEQEVCIKYPSECTDIDPNSLVMRRGLNLDDIITGTKTMVSLLAAGSPTVDQTEADRRAAICAGCRWNQSFSKPCSGICQSLLDVVKGITGAKSTPYDNQLMSCYWCGCFIQASVWVPRDIQWNALNDAQKAKFKQVSHCWKRDGAIA
jgi:hypothetical protein